MDRPMICPFCAHLGPCEPGCPWEGSYAQARWRLGLAMSDLRDDIYDGLSGPMLRIARLAETIGRLWGRLAVGPIRWIAGSGSICVGRWPHGRRARGGLRGIDDCPVFVAQSCQRDVSVRCGRRVVRFAEAEVLLLLDLYGVLGPLTPSLGVCQRVDRMIESSAQVLHEVPEHERQVLGRHPKRMKPSDPPVVLVEIGDDFVGLGIDEPGDSAIESVQVLACSPVLRVGTVAGPIARPFAP